MPKQVNDVLGPILTIAFFVVMGATPLAILVLGVLNFVRDSARRTKIVLQGLGALAIWIFLTFVLVMIFFMTIFEYPAYRSQADDLKSTAIFVIGGFIYFVVGGVLIYWTRRQKKRLPAVGVSC